MNLDRVRALVKIAEENLDKENLDENAYPGAAGVATVVAPVMAQGLISAPIMSGALDGKLKPHEKFNKENVNAMLSRAGYAFEEGGNRSDIYAQNPFNSKKPQYLTSVKQDYYKDLKGNRIAVNMDGIDPLGRGPFAIPNVKDTKKPNTPHIFMPKHLVGPTSGMHNMNTFAHEMGHAIGMNKGTILQKVRMNPATNILGTLPVGSLGIGINEFVRGKRLEGVTDKNKRKEINDTADTINKGVAGVTTLAGLAAVGGELEASYIGAKHLPKGTGFKGKLKPFVGVPTYLAAAAMPAMSYMIAKKYNEHAYSKEKNNE